MARLRVGAFQSARKYLCNAWRAEAYRPIFPKFKCNPHFCHLCQLLFQEAFCLLTLVVLYRMGVGVPALVASDREIVSQG